MAWPPDQEEVRDGEGRPALSDGVAAATLEYDSAGNVIRQTRFGADGKLARSTGANWVLQEIARNERGDVVGRKYFRGEADAQRPSLRNGRSLTTIRPPGRVGVSGSETGGWRCAGCQRQHHRGKHLDAEGQAIVGERLRHQKRAYEFSPEGSRDRAFFDRAGEDVRLQRRSPRHYGVRNYGRLTRMIFDDFMPESIAIPGT